MHMAMRATGAGSLAPRERKVKEGEEAEKKRPPIGYQSLCFMLETLAWGDVGLYLVTRAVVWVLLRSRLLEHPSRNRNSWRASPRRSPLSALWR